MRRGELVGLRRQDVDLAAGTVVPNVPRIVVDGQTATSGTTTENGLRPRALDPVTLAAPRTHIERWEKNRADVGHTNELLFCHPDGTDIHPDSVTDWIQKRVRAAGLPVTRLHDVRHSYATAALKSGVHPKVVSERPGHADVGFTLRIYSHVIPGMDEAAAGPVAGVIFGPDPGGGEKPAVHESVHEMETSPLERGDDEGQSPRNQGWR